MGSFLLLRCYAEAPDKLLEPVESLLEDFVVLDVGDADVTGAFRPKVGPRKDCHPGLVERPVPAEWNAMFECGQSVNRTHHGAARSEQPRP